MANRSRQRGHMDMGLVGWLIVWMPTILVCLGLGFVGLIAWALWRLRK